jgi:hypothetical protein
MRPITIDGSTSSSSYSHPRKRRPTSLPNASKGAVRAPSCRYVHEQRACSVHLCAGRDLRFVQIATQAPVVRLRLCNTLESEVGLGARELGLGTRSLGLRAGPVRILLFRRQPAGEVLFFGLCSRQLLHQVAALVLRDRFVPDNLSVLRPEALNPPLESSPFGSKLRG